MLATVEEELVGDVLELVELGVLADDVLLELASVESVVEVLELGLVEAVVELWLVEDVELGLVLEALWSDVLAVCEFCVLLREPEALPETDPAPEYVEPLVLVEGDVLELVLP